MDMEDLIIYKKVLPMRDIGRTIYNMGMAMSIGKMDRITKDSMSKVKKKVKVYIVGKMDLCIKGSGLITI